MRDRRSADGASVTVRSVASDAGVSVATVSRVLSSTGRVSDELRMRVLASAEKLGYRPNLMAKSLATGKSKQVGLVIPDLRNPFFNDIIRGVDQACSPDGFTMLISDSVAEPNLEAELVENLLRVVDALILVTPRQPVAALNRLKTVGKPVVSIVGPPGIELWNVGVDMHAGMLSVFDHLVSLGHTKTVYLGGPPASSQDLLKRDAIPHAQSRGMDVVVVEAGADIEAGYRALEAALQHEPTAIACYNDLLALGALSGLWERGVSLPADISLTGFDDITFSQFTYPRLTTVRTPRAELGDLAWAAVRALLAGQSVPDPVMLPVSLIPGGTTAAPPPHGS